MNKVADWLVAQDTTWTIVMGDFNWGYPKTSGIENYLGEKRIMALHQSGELFQLFYHLSYLDDSDLSRLRTNMGFRAAGHFYDQFITTPVLAAKLADGGKLLKDCGIVAFDIRSQYMKDAINDYRKQHQYGLDHYLKNAGIDAATNQTAYDKTVKDIIDRSADDATYVISDHRIVWMQLKVW
jgi:hypothetical protein